MCVQMQCGLWWEKILCLHEYVRDLKSYSPNIAKKKITIIKNKEMMRSLENYAYSERECILYWIIYQLGDCYGVQL